MRLLGRIRRAPKGPLAVAGILATPLFFAGLMGFSLKLDKPTVQVSPAGRDMLGDPTKQTVLLIYLAAFAVCALVVFTGVLGLFMRAPYGMFAPSLTAIAASILIRIPLGTWEDEHTARYPEGVDLIPKSDPADLFLRAEWEENAARTAEQLSFWAIAIAIAAMAIALAVEIRRRRQVPLPPVSPLPPGTSAGGASS